jgi:ParB family transcriptional regulator, chromosome partitioning protein
MTAPAAPWQLDRLSTREAAEIASLGSGLSLSSWLTRLIGDTCSAEGVAPPSEAPKILEFTREIRDRATPPRAANAPMAVPPAPVLQAAPEPQPVMAPVPPTVFHSPLTAPAPVAPPQSQPHFMGQPATPAPLIPVPAAPVQVPVQPVTNVTPIIAPRMPAPLPLVAPAFAPAAQTPEAPVAAAPVQPSPPPHSTPSGVTMLTVSAIVAAHLGTRRGEDIPEPLLADIATRGVRQPITVRRSPTTPDQYEVICGHRRWRAAQRVGLGHIPAIVVAQDEATAVLASLAENMLQNNLSVLDEAQAYLRLLTHCAVDASSVTTAVGRDRKHIVQSMRLLGLPPLVRHLVGSGMLSREHAFLLLDAPNPEALADAILAENLSVDATRQRMASTAGAEAKP